MSNTPSRLVSPENCSNTYTCPGGGSGYGIQFNITTYDIDTLQVLSPDGSGQMITVTAAAGVDYRNRKFQTDNPLTWWWNFVVLTYKGLAGPTAMSCIKNGQSGFATGLAQTITAAFGISPSRICNAKLISTIAPNDVDIASVKFVFYITDVYPTLTTPLRNDYLPSSCLGPWIMTWLSKATSVTQPNTLGVTPTVPPGIPLELQSKSCPGIIPGAPARSFLGFTAKITDDKNELMHLENLRASFRSAFSEKSFLSPILDYKEHVTNVLGTSVQLNGSGSSIYPEPQTILDYLCMYAYPLSFFGAICFTIVQFMDININTLVANKNLSLVINLLFILWSIVGLIAFYNIPIYSVPILGNILLLKIPYILPFNTQTVVTQA
jgi:hypothetical protein